MSMCNVKREGFQCKYLQCRCGRMIVGFTTNYMQSVPITTNVVSYNPIHGQLYSATLCDKVCQ